MIVSLHCWASTMEHWGLFKSTIYRQFFIKNASMVGIDMTVLFLGSNEFFKICVYHCVSLWMTLKGLKTCMHDLVGGNDYIGDLVCYHEMFRWRINSNKSFFLSDPKASAYRINRVRDCTSYIEKSFPSVHILDPNLRGKEENLILWQHGY